MGVPKRKNSKCRRDSRRANKGLEVKIPASCQTCNASIASHQVCPECGYYKGVKVIRTKTDRMHDRGQAQKAKEAKIQARVPEAGAAGAAGQPAGDAAKQ